jgi:hypothetical protein
MLARAFTCFLTLGLLCGMACAPRAPDALPDTGAQQALVR